MLEDVWAPYTTIVQSNPLGKVPCLLMEGGEVLFDSRVIVEYLDTLSPVGKLIPSSGRELTKVKLWEALPDGLIDAAIATRMEANWVGRTKNQRSQAWIDRQLRKAHDSLAAMSRGLGDSSMCCGIHLSLADIAVGCALGYLDFRYPDIGWRSNYPNLTRLQDKLMQRSSFTDTVPA